jgi:hypothetical protein
LLKDEEKLDITKYIDSISSSLLFKNKEEDFDDTESQDDDFDDDDIESQDELGYFEDIKSEDEYLNIFKNISKQ